MNDTAYTELDAWLAPLDDADACGPDLEYDADFMALEQAVAGKPETQFAAAEPPDWADVLQQAESLNQRTRDLRVARWWLRARLRTEGFAALPAGLTLMARLLSQWWDELHPRLEDGDAAARANVLADFASLDGLLGDLRQARVLDHALIGQVSVREIEIAQGRLAARDDEMPPAASQIRSMLADAAAEEPALATRAAEAVAALDELEQAFTARAEFAPGRDFTLVREMLQAVVALSPAAEAADEGFDFAALDTADAAPPAAPAARRHAADGEITSRADAVRAIERICAYLQTHEPTNPAQQLLRRAQRLIDLDFLQLVREFAPAAAEEVARMLGVQSEPHL